MGFLDCVCIVIPPLTVILDQLSRDCQFYGITYVDVSKVKSKQCNNPQSIEGFNMRKLISSSLSLSWSLVSMSQHPLLVLKLKLNYINWTKTILTKLFGPCFGSYLRKFCLPFLGPNSLFENILLTSFGPDSLTESMPIFEPKFWLIIRPN